MRIAVSKISIAMLVAAGLVAGCATQTEPEQTPPPAETKAPEQPVAESKPVVTAPPAQFGNYVVKRGDNLWNIAGSPSVYGNAYYWPVIYRTNQAKIRDADLIFPGQQFSIDQNPSSSDVDAAVRHAKTRGAWTLGKVEASDTAYLAR